MTGSQAGRFLLDTNAVIQLLKGNHQVNDLLAGAGYIAISVITQLEFLAFEGISDEDQKVFSAFKKRVEVIDLASGNECLMEAIYKLRSQSSLKLPDAIIAASAEVNNALLVTADRKLLKQSGQAGVDFDLK